jgi:hypothetical protein
VYANQGYGAPGVFKTVNGGVDWDQVLTPNITATMPYGGFVSDISMDPDEPKLARRMARRMSAALFQGLLCRNN